MSYTYVILCNPAGDDMKCLISIYGYDLLPHNEIVMVKQTTSYFKYIIERQPFPFSLKICLIIANKAVSLIETIIP